MVGSTNPGVGRITTKLRLLLLTLTYNLILEWNFTEQQPQFQPFNFQFPRQQEQQWYFEGAQQSRQQQQQLPFQFSSFPQKEAAFIAPRQQQRFQTFNQQPQQQQFASQEQQKFTITPISSVQQQLFQFHSNQQHQFNHQQQYQYGPANEPKEFLPELIPSPLVKQQQQKQQQSISKPPPPMARPLPSTPAPISSTQRVIKVSPEEFNELFPKFLQSPDQFRQTTFEIQTNLGTQQTRLQPPKTHSQRIGIPRTAPFGANKSSSSLMKVTTKHQPSTTTMTMPFVITTQTQLHLAPPASTQSAKKDAKLPQEFDLPPPPPSRFLPEEEKMRIADLVKQQHRLRNPEVPLVHDGVAAPEFLETISTNAPLKNALPTHSSTVTEASSTGISKKNPNKIFLDCCKNKGVPKSCESRCNFDVLNKKILTGMFLGSDKCPTEYGLDLFTCAAQDSDHSACCRQKRVQRTSAGEKCLAFCNLSPDAPRVSADASYLPCWAVLNEVKSCFREGIVNGLNSTPRK